MHNSYMKLTYNWVFVWALLLVLAFVAHPTHASGTQRELLGIVNAPSGSFWDTGMRLCDIDDNGKCHSGKYALSILRFGAGGIAAAGLSLLFFIFFIPIRFLCNGFGGKNKSYGICPSSSDTRSYKRSEIVSVKVVAGLVLIPVVIAVAIGFVANSDISDSVDTITVSIVASGDNILQTLIRVRDAVLQIDNSTSARMTFNNAINTATDISTDMHNVKDTVHTYDGVREGLMIAATVCCVVLVVLGIICAIFNLRVFAMILGLFSLLVLTIIWLSFGAHLVAGKFDYDVCVDIDLLVKEQNSGGSSSSVFKTGALANLWNCNDNQDLVDLQNLINNSIISAADNACSLRSRICYNAVNNTGDPNWQCDSTPACGPTTLAVVTDSDHLVILDSGTPRSLVDCANNCTSATYKNASIAIVSAVALYTEYTDLYYNDVLPIINCQIAVDVLVEVRDPLCNDLSDSIFGVAVSSLIIGIFYIPFIVAMIIGFKRFRSLSGGIV